MEEEKSFLKICRHIGKYTIPDVFRKLPFKLKASQLTLTCLKLTIETGKSLKYVRS